MQQQLPGNSQDYIPEYIKIVTDIRLMVFVNMLLILNLIEKLTVWKRFFLKNSIKNGASTI